jgi:Alpha/beta hydrolase
MADFGDVRRWDPEPLNASVGELNRRCDQLLGLADELTAACQPAGWVGDAAYVAATEARKHTDKLEEQVAGVAAVRRALAEAADAITGLRHAVAEIDSLAHANGFEVVDNGSVVERATVGKERDLDRVKAELADRVEQVLRRAADIDEDLTIVVNRARAEQTLDGDQAGLTNAAQAGAARGSLSVAGPPQGGSVYDNAGWWDALSAIEQQQIIKEHPDWIGNRDGVPAAARDAANRARIPGERTAIQRQIEELEARSRALMGDRHKDPRVKMGEQMALNAEIAKARIKLEAIEALGPILAKGDRQLLLLDLSGDRAKAAIASGDVDKAEHVAVFTPGMNSTVNGSFGGYVNDMDSLRVHSQRELRRYGDDATVATVAWLGYEPPSTSENPLDALGEGSARDGGDRLAPFLNGIDASRDIDPHLTALGHSYGSLTTGLALQQNTGADDAVVFGSPGLGTSDPGKIMIDHGHTYNLEADGDVVADLGDPLIHGADPSSLPIPQLSTHDAVTPDGQQLHGSHGHSEYTWDDTTSQYNMSVIVAGMNNRVIPAG